MKNAKEPMPATRVSVFELRTKPIVKAPRVTPITTRVARTALTTMPGYTISKKQDSAPSTTPSMSE